MKSCPFLIRLFRVRVRVADDTPKTSCRFPHAYMQGWSPDELR
jgi:hypothetical protein